MTDRQKEILDFIQSRDCVHSNSLISNFGHWFSENVAENLGRILTTMVRQKLIEVIDGRYQIYDATAHSVDAEPENDNQLNLF
jgi:hypothetical protein